MDVKRLLPLTVLFVALHAAPAQAHTTAQVKLIIRQEVARAGWGRADADAAVRLACRESTWRDWVHSRSECHGVFQLSRAMAHGHPWSDPRWNSRRAMAYIRGRYGTPRRALQHSLAHNWY